MTKPDNQGVVDVICVATERCGIRFPKTTYIVEVGEVVRGSHHHQTTQQKHTINLVLRKCHLRRERWEADTI